MKCHKVLTLLSFLMTMSILTGCTGAKTDPPLPPETTQENQQSSSQDHKYDALVFFDLDGTLLNEETKVPKENMLAIKEMQANNILPIISTGRAPKELEGLTEGSGIDSYVALNGQVIKVNGEFIYKDAIDSDLIAEFVEYTKEQNNNVLFQSDYSAAATGTDANVEGLCAMDNVPLPAVDEAFYKNNEVYYLYLYVGEGEEKDDLYADAFQGRLSFTRDSPYTIAVITDGHSKGTGIRKLIEEVGQQGVPTYAFGDGNNDVLMFDEVDTAIAMGNGKDALKEKADFITASNAEGGIVQGLQHYNLIQ